jgi:hypothetical protein
MQIRRLLVPLCLTFSLAACASAPTRHNDERPEISFDLSVSPVRARDQIAAAFTANGLPIAASQPGAVEFHGPRERGVLGYYEVFARAVILPADCGTHVTLFGEQTRYDNSTSLRGTATRIGPASSGRALDVWRKLQAVASALRTDSVTAPRTKT